MVSSGSLGEVGGPYLPEAADVAFDIARDALVWGEFSIAGV